MSDNPKQIFRERILTLLRNQKEEERLAKSLAIKDKLFQMREFQKAKTILFYASFNGEVKTFEMMSEAQKLGKTIGLPRIAEDKNDFIPLAVVSLERDLELGAYGIKQPKSNPARVLNKDSIDLVIVPGVAFDQNNNRLGRGGGHYDRFLAELPPDIPTVGLAFDFQIVDDLSSQEGHDMPVSCVLVN
ncbi:MAG: 5-formyltetrahydrofolate cyclo-ligase [Omnitrophica WOR_2 bacterium RIFCSPHIGHO2_02_FULL_52_10]|nr:MAG: 5-formyltetrahydrofolate cyclo-ligase [Omnitrophica WOR_2 bacterium RIFCSPHIGHO2_02_FULL_52_10]